MATFSNEKNKIKEIFSTLVQEEKCSGITPPEASTTIYREQADNDNEVSCNPQSKDLFLQRVKTFTTTTWAAKPLELSPLHCAQYGWCNEHQDQLRCVTCNATIYAGIPDEWDSTAYAEICNKIQDELQIGHEKLCPWPKNPCPTSFLSLPSYTVDQWKGFTKDAFESLLLCRNNLPELNEDEVASMRRLDNSNIEKIIQTIFKYYADNDDEALQGKVACILALCGWSACKPIVEDPSITCTMCGMEAGLWNYKSISNRPLKRAKVYSDATSQQSLPEYRDVMSSSVSVKSEKSETERSETEKSENSNHSGSVSHELSKLATSSDSLAQSDLLRPAGSQESLVNLRVSDSKMMAVDNIDHQYTDDYAHPPRHDKIVFSEPRLPHATPPELMKELLLSTAPGSHRSHSIYSDSIFSEVGSECFEKRLEDTNDKDLELDKAVTENPPTSHPNHMQQQWMKELLFMTAENKTTDITESVLSDIGSVSFDRRLDTSSVINSPRAMTPVYRGNSILDEEEGGEQVRTKRMRFQEPDISYFSVLGEHRHWCPWIAYDASEDDNSGSDSSSTSSMLTAAATTPKNNTKNVASTHPMKLTPRQPGWKVVLSKLMPSISGFDATKNMSPQPSDAWRSVRTVLGDCVSPAVKNS